MQIINKQRNFPKFPKYCVKIILEQYALKKVKEHISYLRMCSFMLRIKEVSEVIIQAIAVAFGILLSDAIKFFVNKLKEM